MEIQHATTDEQLLQCFATVNDLRPHITREVYLQKARLLLSEGAQMIYINEGAKAPAFAVFRLNYYFYRGYNMYIDDLNTLPQHRGKGYAGMLMDYLINYAKQKGCDNIHLDSGYQQERWDAHRF
jgi:GNAT superfamily N-acetyltransferase